MGVITTRKDLLSSVIKKRKREIVLYKRKADPHATLRMQFEDAIFLSIHVLLTYGFSSSLIEFLSSGTPFV